MTLIEHNGILFKKSSYSPRELRGTCVGVSFNKSSILVINTNKRDNMISFTHEEWRAFIKGAKDGEFDLEDNNNDS